MTEQKRTLQELSNAVLVEMERLGYTESTREIYRKCFNRIIKFADAKRTEYFSEDLGAAYLKEKYDYPGCSLTNHIRHTRKCVKRLGEYQLYGAFVHAILIKNEPDWSAQDSELIKSYAESVQSSDNSEATKKLRIYHIKLFYKFLGHRGLSGIGEVTPEVISDYVKYMHNFALVYVKHRLATLRYYFRYLYSNGYCDTNLSFAVPRIKAPANANVPALWSKEDIEQLLLSVDRGNPTGKRNYAVLCLVVNLGMRLRDLVEMKLEHLKWDRKEIEFHQHKTGNKVIYPILSDIGWAIIDYLRYGRPKSESPYLFLSANAPHDRLLMDGYANILKTHTRIAGIKKGRNTVRGMHSLRHALARNLMEQNVPLPVLSDIMGHTSVVSSSPYLKVDIEGLRKCSLTLGGFVL